MRDYLYYQSAFGVGNIVSKGTVVQMDYDSSERVRKQRDNEFTLVIFGTMLEDMNNAKSDLFPFRNLISRASCEYIGKYDDNSASCYSDVAYRVAKKYIEDINEKDLVIIRELKFDKFVSEDEKRMVLESLYYMTSLEAMNHYKATNDVVICLLLDDEFYKYKEVFDWNCNYKLDENTSSVLLYK